MTEDTVDPDTVSDDLVEAGFDFNSDASKYTLDNWSTDRISYASDMDRSTLAKYKSSINYIAKTVFQQFPSKVGIRNDIKTKTTDIMVDSRDTMSARQFDSVSKYYNKVLTKRKMVAKVPGLPDTVLYSGIDRDDKSASNSTVDLLYVLLVTKGEIVSIFYINPELYFGGQEDDMEWNA